MPSNSRKNKIKYTSWCFGKNIDNLSQLITKNLVMMNSFRKIPLFKQMFNTNMEFSINNAVPQTGKEVIDSCKVNILWKFFHQKFILYIFYLNFNNWAIKIITLKKKKLYVAVFSTLHCFSMKLRNYNFHHKNKIS